MEYELSEPRVLCNISTRGWCVHFVEGQSGIGPWLLFDNLQQIVEQVLRWGHVTEAELQEALYDLRRWSATSVPLHLSASERESLIARKRGWPWNGFELEQMRKAGRYPPQRLRI